MEGTSWHSYPHIYAIGHRYTENLFDGPVLVEEKVDGSQFSFGIFDGEVKCRSKGQIIHTPDKMFQAAFDTAHRLGPVLRGGWTYRGEVLCSPKHNTLKYGRVPAGNVILFDVNPAEERYLSYSEKKEEADRLGLEVVPVLYEGIVTDASQLLSFLERESVLGGCKVEGVVVKNYAQCGPDKKALMGKYVSEAFKEAHVVAWKVSNPSKSDVVASIVAALKTDARWQKAVQHLKEAGTLDGSPKDIGDLIKEVQADVKRECADQVADALLRWAWPHILRGVTTGLPDWYKKTLIESAFGCPGGEEVI